MTAAMQLQLDEAGSLAERGQVANKKTVTIRSPPQHPSAPADVHFTPNLRRHHPGYFQL